MSFPCWSPRRQQSGINATGAKSTMTVSRRKFGTMALAVLPAGMFPGWAASANAGKTQGMTHPGTSSAPSGGTLVPEHFVPIPGTVSTQAQAMLAHKPPVGGLEIPKSREDLAGWVAYRRACDSGILQLTRSYAEQYPSTVVTHELGAAKLYEITPRDMAKENKDRAILFVHGGGWVVGGGEAAIYSPMQMAGMAKVRVYSVDYRLVPEFAFPAPVEDTVEAYRFLLGRHKPGHIAVYAASAGANIAPGAILMARDLGLPLPAACALHSCPSDITFAGDSFYTNYMVDTVLRERGPNAELASNYANGHDPRDPRLSPVHADFSRGFPPTVLTTGTRDLLLSPTVAMHRALLRGGIKAELHVWEAMTHAPFFGAPEEQELYHEHLRFMLGHMT